MAEAAEDWGVPSGLCASPSLDRLREELQQQVGERDALYGWVFAIMERARPCVLQLLPVHSPKSYKRSITLFFASEWFLATPLCFHMAKKGVSSGPVVLELFFAA